MTFYPGKIYHIYNRGINQQNIFFERKNYIYFLQKMESHLLKHTDLLAWCLMPNHFHWMIKVHDQYPISNHFGMEESNPAISPKVAPINRSISTLLSSYTKGVNKMYNRSGSLFQQRTKTIDLNAVDNSDDYYPIICFNYIHQNPLKAKLVNRLEDYEFSSFKEYSTNNSDGICNKPLCRELLELPTTHEEFIGMSYRMIPDEWRRRLL